MEHNKKVLLKAKSTGQNVTVMWEYQDMLCTVNGAVDHVTDDYVVLKKRSWAEIPFTMIQLPHIEDISTD